MVKLPGSRWFVTSALLLALEYPALAQIPLGPELLVNSRIDYVDSQAVGCNEESICAFTWGAVQPAQEGNGTWLFAKTFSPQGEVLSERELRRNDFTRNAPVIGLPDGFAILWDKVSIDGHGGPALQLFDEFLNNQSDVIELPFAHSEFRSIWAAARTPLGYVLLTLDTDLNQPDPECETCELGVFLYFVDEAGRELRGPQRVNEDTSGNEQPHQAFGGLAVDGSGNIIVSFWRGYKANQDDRDVFVRRFSPEGQPLGPEVRVNTYLPGAQWHAQLAAAPGGEFVVVWQSEAQDGELEGIYARRFSADGLPIGDEFRVNEITRSAQRFPNVAMDRHGNFAVTWQDFVPGDDGHTVFLWDIKGRLFHADGTPVAGEMLLNQKRNFDQIISVVAWAPNGTLLVGWASTTDRPESSGQFDVKARRFAAWPGEEPCATVGSRLLCDTGRTGGMPELSLTFGGRPGEVTLLGDADGDGREDVCAWWQGVFRCDLDHEGAPTEWKVSFGRPTDTPLLGDVDGDGKAEPCVRRKRQLRCLGSRGVTATSLPQGGGTPLLGDLDGDGRDDVCLVARGVWTCLTRKGVWTSFSFGGRDDAPVLGDLDRDGRSDPCVLRAGRLLCDTAHDGGQAEAFLDMDLSAGARPLFGNIDGL